MKNMVYKLEKYLLKYILFSLLKWPVSHTYLGHNTIDNANKAKSKPSICNAFICIMPRLIWPYLNETNVYVQCPIYGTQKKHLLDSFMINAKHVSVQTVGSWLK